MKNKVIFNKLIILVLAVFFVACDNKPKFIIKGNIADADEQTIYLERRGLTSTSLVDSVKIKKDGSFKFQAEAPAYPELYLLKLEKGSINLAVDSTETIEIESSLSNFSTNYEVKGSESSLKIKQIVEAYQKLSIKVRDLQQKFNKGEIGQNLYADGVDSVLTPYKKEIKSIIASDFKSPAAYFALFQKIDEYLLLDPYDREDGKMYTAVATAWDTFYKESERSRHLYEFTMKVLKERRLANNQTSGGSGLSEIKSVDFFDISLPDINGNDVVLSSLTGKVILLDFTSYLADYSPAYNVKLNEVYKQFNGQFEIYQVAFDADTHLWKNTATNLPWLCVRDARSTSSDLLLKYNVSQLPTAFLMNKNGEVVKRLTGSDKLKEEVQKLL